jgi:peptide/nickel transport system substrate-binding protein
MMRSPQGSRPVPSLSLARSARLPLALGAAAALLVTACGGDSAPGERSVRGMPAFCQDVLPKVDAWVASHPQPTGDRFGGTVVVGSIGEIADGMNALVSSDYTANQYQLFVNLMPLIRLDDAFEPIPWLAESWTLDEGNTRLTFRVRQDVYWHDGTPTTARDVVFTYLRATDPQTAFPNSAFWTHYVRGPEGIELIDDYTVQIRLRPHAEILDPWVATAIMPAHLLEDVPPAELKQHPFGTRCPVGNGPFVFRDHRQDESWTFIRNPAFPDALGGPPLVDRHVYRIIPEQTTLLTELLTENIDIYIAPGPDQAPQIQAAAHLDLRDFWFRNYLFVGWNSRRPQLSDARVRRALTVGTNRAEIVEALLRGYGTVANSGVPPFHWAYYAPILDSLAYNPNEARRLLDEAGWSEIGSDGIRRNADGLRMEIVLKYNQGNQQRQDIAEIMQSQLREIGVSLRPQVVEWATLLNQINTPSTRDFDGVVMGWVTEFKLDDTNLFHSRSFETPYAWSGTQNPRLDMLLDTLQLIVDRDEALPFWREYQYEIMKEQPYTFFFFPKRLGGVNKRVQGVRQDVRGEWVTAQEWWIPADQRGRR